MHFLSVDDTLVHTLQVSALKRRIYQLNMINTHCLRSIDLVTNQFVCLFFSLLLSSLLIIVEMCSGHGYHIQRNRNPNSLFPAVLSIDCMCDSGWAGPRCHFPCNRNRPEDPCFSQHRLPFVPGNAAFSKSRTRFLPQDLCPSGYVRSFEKSASCVSNYINTRRIQMTPHEAYVGYLTNIDYQSTNLAKIPTVCYFDPFIMNKSYMAKVRAAMTYVPSTKTQYVQEPKPEDPWTGIVPPSPYHPYVLCDIVSGGQFRRTFHFIRHVYLDYTTYDCTPERLIEYSYNNGFKTTFRNYYRNSTQPSFYTNRDTPCVWGTNPRVNPLHIGEVPGVNIAYPLNFNDGGIDQSLYKLDGVAELVTSDMIQCPDTNQFIRYLGSGNATSAGPWTCQQCSPTCRSDQYCQTNPATNYQTGVCVCKGQYSHYNATIDTCIYDFCEYGKYGYYCENQCQTCPEGTRCDDGVFGTGLCECPGGGRPNPFTLVCEEQDCGPLNACNNNGICIQTGTFDYCMCNRGYDGLHCQFNRNSPIYSNPVIGNATTSTGSNNVYIPLAASSRRRDECDCSVFWNPVRFVDSSNAFPTNLQILIDYNTLIVPNVNPLFGNTGIRLVGNADQAKYLCYQDALCVGFVMYELFDYWRQTLQQDQGVTVYNAIFYQRITGVATINNRQFPSGVALEFHTIERFASYPCSSATQQIRPYYYNQYFTAVQPYCNYVVDQFALNNPTAAGLNKAIVCASNDIMIAHWRYVGHLARIQPNPSCVLKPSLYDPETYCATSRCPSNAGVPCSGNGYCADTQSSSTVTRQGQFAPSLGFDRYSNITLSWTQWGVNGSWGLYSTDPLLQSVQMLNGAQTVEWWPSTASVSSRSTPVITITNGGTTVQAEFVFGQFRAIARFNVFQLLDRLVIQIASGANRNWKPYTVAGNLSPIAGTSFNMTWFQPTAGGIWRVAYDPYNTINTPTVEYQGTATNAIRGFLSTASFASMQTPVQFRSRGGGSTATYEGTFASGAYSLTYNYPITRFAQLNVHLQNYISTSSSSFDIGTLLGNRVKKTLSMQWNQASENAQWLLTISNEPTVNVVYVLNDNIVNSMTSGATVQSLQQPNAISNTTSGLQTSVLVQFQDIFESIVSSAIVIIPLLQSFANYTVVVNPFLPKVEYACKCNAFNRPSDSGFLSLNGKPAWYGNTCQFDVQALCVQPGAATICSDHPDRCLARKTYNGNFFITEFETLPDRNDYVPYCHCENTAKTGTYCEESECGRLSGRLVVCIGDAPCDAELLY